MIYKINLITHSHFVKIELSFTILNTIFQFFQTKELPNHIFTQIINSKRRVKAKMIKLCSLSLSLSLSIS